MLILKQWQIIYGKMRSNEVLWQVALPPPPTQAHVGDQLRGLLPWAAHCPSTPPSSWDDTSKLHLLYSVLLEF